MDKKTILITGASGFFGHHLVEHILKNTDFDIVALDRINYAGNLNRLKDISIFEQNKHRFKLVWHDLRAEINDGIVKEIGEIDYVVHTAAETHVERSLVNSVPFVMSNVLGTCNLLEYIKKHCNIEKYIQFSTDEVFGSAPFGIDYKEWDTHKPSNPYSASKAGADDLAFSFYHSFRLPIIISHTMNMFGERQHTEKFVPMTIRNVLLGDKVIIHGKQGQISTRKWIHCRNVSEAVLYLLDNGVSGDKYNIAGHEASVLELAEFIAEIVNKPLNYEFLDFHSTRPGHDLRYSLDDSKLVNMGLKYKVPFWDSLEKVIKWYLNNQKWLGL